TKSSPPMRKRRRGSEEITGHAIPDSFADEHGVVTGGSFMLPTITCLADVAQVVHRAKKQLCSLEFAWQQESGGACSERRNNETYRSGDSSKRFLDARCPPRRGRGDHDGAAS